MKNTNKKEGLIAAGRPSLNTKRLKLLVNVLIKEIFSTKVRNSIELQASLKELALAQIYAKVL